MNILYMHTHDMGRYIQPYGYAIPTPNMMKLAEEGTLFRHAYCTGPTCSPSRAGLLTGMAAHTCGMTGLAHRGFKLHDYSMHLVQYLNGQGYETALCGIQHEAPDARMIGYRRLLGEEDNKGNEVRDKSEWDLANAGTVADYLHKNREKKFFLSFGMVNPHRDFPEAHPDINPDYVVPPFPLYDTAENRKDTAAYMTSVMTADRCVGIVLNALKEAGLEDTTIVILTTDHGIAFPKMKCNLYDTGIGVSLIIRYPGNPMKGKATDALVSQIDLFPTLCDLLNLESPEWLQGYSMLPVLKGETDRIREEVFSEVTYHAAYEPMRCIRTDRYKLIRFYDEHDRYVPANIDDGFSKSFLLENGYLEEKREKEQLFDLYLDPVERVNRVQDERYQAIRSELGKRLDTWMLETADPLLAGRVEKPAGAIANKVSCLSPNERDFE